MAGIPRSAAAPSSHSSLRPLLPVAAWPSPLCSSRLLAVTSRRRTSCDVSYHRHCADGACIPSAHSAAAAVIGRSPLCLRGHGGPAAALLAPHLPAPTASSFHLLLLSVRDLRSRLMAASPPTTPRTSLMSADSEMLREQERAREREQQEELQQRQSVQRDHSSSQLSTNSVHSKRGLERDPSVPDSLNRQLSASQLRRSRSRTGGTAANIPLSTQAASTLLSPAGERVRAYSDSQSALEARIANSRQYSDGTPLDAHQEQPEDVTPLSQRKQQQPQLTDITINISPAQMMSGAERRGSQVAEAEQQQQVSLIAFVNFHSGGKTGRKIAALLQAELGQGSVYNLDSANPTRDLERHLHTRNLRVAVCGGDGTVNWVLSCIGALPFHPLPAVGVIPLGTGNDTARAFGWGYKYPGKRGIVRSVRRMRDVATPVVTFDRWHATVDHRVALNSAQIKGLPAAMREMREEPQFLGYRPPKQDAQHPQYRAVVGADDDGKSAYTGPPHADSSAAMLPPSPDANRTSTSDAAIDAASGTAPSQAPLRSVSAVHQSKSTPSLSGATVVRRELQFNNYLSFGIDAQIQFEFHEHRETHRHLYMSRLCNMGWITLWGAENLLCCQARELLVRVEVPDLETGEWREITLPPNIRSIVLLNGTTYAGGRHIWGHSASRSDEYSGPPPAYNDGLLELVGTENTLHLSLMLIKVRRAIRIAQVHEVRITTESAIHAQLDGEPWEEQSSVYHIRRLQQALMIDNKKHKKGARPGSDE